MGVEYLGINGLFSEILQMLSLADLGFGTAMVFSMYKPLAENDKNKLAQLTQLYKKIYTIIAISITIIGIALVPFLQYIVNFDQGIPYIKIYYLLYLANTVSSYLVVYKTCILNADQKNYIISKYDTLFNLLSTIGCTIFLIITKNFMIYLIVQVFFTYAKNFYESHIAQKMYPYISNKVPKLSKNEISEIYMNVKSVFIYKFSTTLISSTDNTITSILIGTNIVGLYSNYSMIISNITLIINIIFSSLTASIGNLVIEKNTQKNYSVYKLMQLFSFIFSVIVITCVFLLIDDFITLWIGEKYVLDNLTVIAIVINMYFSIVLMPIWSYREATGMYRQIKYVMVITALVNIILSIILGNLIGLAGILIATSIARITTYFWYEPKILYSQFFDVNVFYYYKSVIKNIIITLIVITISYYIFRNFFINTWIGFVIKALLLLFIVISLTLLFYSRDNELKNLKNLIKRSL